MPKILIVDDATFMRVSLKKILERNGFEVIGEAENGISAIKKCAELKPDIITMDITMPEMDGLSALKEIKRVYPEVKVVMVSAMGQEPFVREAVMSGARDFIVKPFSEELIVKTMNNLCK